MRSGSENRFLNAMVVCKSAQRRSLLQKGMSEHPVYETVRQSSGLQEALEKLEKGPHLDVLFISPEYPRDDLVPFLNDLRQKGEAADTAAILLMDSTGSDEDVRQQNLWRKSGIDSFLMAPYTLETFREVTEESFQILDNRKNQRLTVKIRSFVNVLLAQLNLVALQKKSGSPKLPENIKKLNELKETVATFTPEEMGIYMTLMIQVTTDAARSERAGVYHGASARLRRKYQKKLSLELSNL